MTIQRCFNRCLMRPGDLKASQDDLRVVGAFNPGAVATSKGIILMIRVAESVREIRKGYVALPRWDPYCGRVMVDWLEESEVDFEDSRVVMVRRTGCRRLTFLSHLRVAHSRDGRTVESFQPGGFFPAGEEEEYGVEDPRITPFEGKYLFTYVAVSRHGAATALASTNDFQSFQRHGIIFPPENKDVVLFPERVDGKILALHRPNPAYHFSPPEMWLATSPDAIHWGEHRPFLTGTGNWQTGRVGAGTPPIRTKDGWLAIYHGNDQKPGESGIGTYSAGAVVMDPLKPSRILADHGPILVPESDYECQGFVPNVLFPTGIIPRKETALIYYGAADESCAVVECKMTELLGQT